jgi:hypothetical protein
MPATPATTMVTHYHVTESNVGCLPEAEPYLTDDPGLALDMLAQLLSSWAETETAEPDARQAVALADLYRASPGDSSRGDPAETLARLPAGRGGICHAVGLREFEIQVCGERDCLKYCPDGSCTTTTPVTDTDPWCWCCGRPYVPWDACPWLN